MPTPTLTASVQTSPAPPTTAALPPLSIRGALTVAGATMDQAPDALAPILDTSTCGLVRITNSSRLGRIPGAGERRCFLDALVTRRFASVVTISDTIEGAPIVVTDVVLADGSVATFHDSTRDPFGGLRWSLGRCERLTLRPERFRVPDPSWYEHEACATTNSVKTDGPVTSPDFVGRRTALPLCGYELSRDQPNTSARQCFRDAIVNGQPAEFIFVNANALGRPITYWQRTAGDGMFELLIHYQPQADSPSRTWVREQCDGVSVREGASPVVLGSECRNIDSMQT